MYVYSGSSPVAMVDVSGLEWGIPGVDPVIPRLLPFGQDCVRRTHLAKERCPSIVGEVRNTICKAITSIGSGGLVTLGVVTGPRHAKCLVDWCGPSGGNIYCTPSTDSVCWGPKCGLSCRNDGYQNPQFGITICNPAAIVNPSCNEQSCSSGIVETILHEVNGICGVSHRPKPRFSDGCDDYANRQCTKLGL